MLVQEDINPATDRFLEELNRYHDSVIEMMQQMDRNRDGFVSISELQSSLQRVLPGHIWTSLDLASVWSHFDTNKSGLINYSELYNAVMSYRARVDSSNLQSASQYSLGGTRVHQSAGLQAVYNLEYEIQTAKQGEIEARRREMALQRECDELKARILEVSRTNETLRAENASKDVLILRANEKIESSERQVATCWLMMRYLFL